MKLSNGTKRTMIALMVCCTTSYAVNALAASSSTSSKIKDFKLKAKVGKGLRNSDVSLAVRNIFPGARPRISKMKVAGKPHCYHVKFIYKDELKRLSFNCTNTKLIMQAKH